MCSCHSILECCVTFSGVKLSIRSFVLFLPNSILGFFDTCVTLKFYLRDPSEGSLIKYRNENNVLMEDIYGNSNSYQSHCMDMLGELMTFCVGGPRFFENNVLLENSPLWTERT